MSRTLAAYAATLLAMLLLDGLWLGLIARPLYQQGIGHLMAERPNLLAAGVFYALYPVGLVVFALLPHAADPAWRATLLAAALFGLLAYATYDLSNLATLRQWPLGLSLIDIAWGTAASVAAAAAGKAALRFVGPG